MTPSDEQMIVQNKNKYEDAINEIFKIVGEQAKDSNIVYENANGEMFAESIEQFSQERIDKIIDNLHLTTDSIIENSRKNGTDRTLSDLATLNLLCYYKEEIDKLRQQLYMKEQMLDEFRTILKGKLK
jgi:hypothetical protein